MPYDVTLVSVLVPVGGFGAVGGYMGFPPSSFPSAGGNFSTVLYSQWMCGAIGLGHAVGIGPAFTGFFDFNVIGGSVTCYSWSPTDGDQTTFTGSFTPPAGAIRHHCLLSINAASQVVQLYIDDQPVAVSGSWAKPAGSTPFNLAFSGSTYWLWNVENIVGSGPIYPGVTDVWCANLAGDAWVDLRVVANRRKFIHADLSPVDLGSDGSEPFGTAPQIFCTVPSGGVATDLLTNRGSGGTTFGLSSGGSLAFQAPGTCSLPTLPPPPPSLAMDDVVAIDQTPAFVAGSQVFLDFSDDRGHSYGNPLGQPIGATGAYLTNVQWQRLGLARDRCFRLTWSVPVATALQGAWIEVTSAKS